MSNSQKGFAPILIILGIVLLLGIAGGAYYVGKIVSTPPDIVPVITSIPKPSPTPNMSPISTPIVDETANWKIYTSKILSFKYPITLTLEERQPGYVVLLTDPNPQSVLVSIDARQSGNYDNYDKAISTAKASLTNVQTEEMVGEVKISGKVGPGFGEGQQITIALFKYGTGAIEAETTTTNQSQLQIFNQILSTFKFTN